MDDVSTWLDVTNNLIDMYEDREKEVDDGKVSVDDALKETDFKHEGEVKEEMVHVVEEILVSLCVTRCCEK